MPDPSELEEKARQSDEDAQKLRDAAKDARSAEEKEKETEDQAPGIL